MWKWIRNWLIARFVTRSALFMTKKYYAGSFKCPMSAQPCELFAFIESQCTHYTDFKTLHFFSHAQIGCPSYDDAKQCLSVDMLGGTCGARALRILNSSYKNMRVTADESTLKVSALNNAITEIMAFPLPLSYKNDD